jgi:hypothetical protein
LVPGFGFFVLVAKTTKRTHARVLMWRCGLRVTTTGLYNTGALSGNSLDNVNGG